MADAAIKFDFAPLVEAVQEWGRQIAIAFGEISAALQRTATKIAETPQGQATWHLSVAVQDTRTEMLRLKRDVRRATKCEFDKALLRLRAEWGL